jgi:retron-type reverse transcriptase
MIPLSNGRKKYLIKSLGSMTTLSDLTDILNLIIDYMDNDKLYKIAPKTLVHYGNYKKRPINIYKKFTILKKNGKERTILSPNPSLKLIQRCIATLLSVVYEPNANVMGFVNDKSIKDNAQVHVGKYYVYNVDIKDFFPSISIHRVKAVLKLAPFNLNTDTKITERTTDSNGAIKPNIDTEGKERLAFLIANICTFEGVLPQGAPTSPILSNIVCQRLDRRLQGLAKRFGAAYTRYADDITFSSYTNIFSAEFKAELTRIIKTENFELNPDKERLQKPAHRQVVTGLTVNEKVNVSQKYIRDLRATLHNWEKLDLEQAINIFNKHQFATKK